MKMLLDLHIHSRRSYDNINGPSIRQIFDQANRLGLQGIAITDHNRLLQVQEYSTVAKAYDLTLISGIEITCDDGHLIVLGLEEEPPEFQSITAADTYLRDKYCFVIAAHPFDPVYGIQEKIYDLNIDAIEINGRRQESINSRARLVAKELDLPQIGSSDAHSLRDIGRKQTLVDTKNDGESAIIDELRSGNCKVM